MTPAQVFSCGYCENFKNSSFEKHLGNDSFCYYYKLKLNICKLVLSTFFWYPKKWWMILWVYEYMLKKTSVSLDKQKHRLSTKAPIIILLVTLVCILHFFCCGCCCFFVLHCFSWLLKILYVTETCLFKLFYEFT